MVRAIRGALLVCLFAAFVVPIVAAVSCDAPALGQAAQSGDRGNAANAGDGAVVAARARIALSFGATDADRVAAVRRALAPVLAAGTAGFVVATPDGAVVASVNANTRLIPASNQKVLTTGAALSLLPADFAFETVFVGTAAVRDGVLPGDLVVIGDGDPSISKRFDGANDPTGPFRAVAAKLRERGVARIAGDLVLDASVFDARYIHPSWPADQRLRWYEAPIAGLSFEDNCVRVEVTPARQDGARATVRLRPAGHGIALSGVVRTQGRGRPRIAIARTPDGGLRVTGTIPARSAAYETDITVADPVRYFGNVLRAVLIDEGIAIDGAVRIGGAADRERATHRLAVWRTPLDRVVAVCNTRSQNSYAEHLAKRLGVAVDARQPGSFASGAAATRDWMIALGVDPEHVTLVDGSGMSRDNRVTPAALALVLLNLAAAGGDAPARFRASLAVSGDPGGTLKYRYRDAGWAGRVRGKTGSLNGVDAVCGYVLDGPEAAADVRYVFVAIANSRAAHSVARAALDAAVRAACAP